VRVPIRYTIDHERSVLVARASGDLTDAELLDYARALHADDTAKEVRHELVDLRDVQSGDGVTSSGVRELAEFWRNAGVTDGKLALIAESPVSYGMSRMYQTLRDDGPDRIEVFRLEEDAWKWLADD
jgi:hypothetical protein